MSFSTALKTVGRGILDAGAAIHNAQVDSQITQIDEEASALRAQLARIEEERTELVQSKY